MNHPRFITLAERQRSADFSSTKHETLSTAWGRKWNDIEWGKGEKNKIEAFSSVFDRRLHNATKFRAVGEIIFDLFLCFDFNFPLQLSRSSINNRNKSTLSFERKCSEFFWDWNWDYSHGDSFKRTFTAFGNPPTYESFPSAISHVESFLPIPGEYFTLHSPGLANIIMNIVCPLKLGNIFTWLSVVFSFISFPISLFAGLSLLVNLFFAWSPPSAKCASINCN